MQAVVHLNCGLHDVKKEFGSTVAAVPLAEYEANLRQIVQRTRAGIKGAVIWATATPVNERRHHARKEFDRLEADVRAYNDAALGVMRELAVPVDDLYAAIMAAGRDELLGEDGVHFSEAGYSLLGRTVADAIRPYLG